MIVQPLFEVGDEVVWRGFRAIVHQVPHDAPFSHRSDYELIVPDLDNDMVACSPDQLKRYMGWR